MLGAAILTESSERLKEQKHTTLDAGDRAVAGIQKPGFAPPLVQVAGRHVCSDLSDSYAHRGHWVETIAPTFRRP